MDFSNQIVQLCAAGIEAESHECFREARVLFLQAWIKSTDDREACIAAHYVARHQADLEDALRWHQLALARLTVAAEHDDAMLPWFALYHANVAKAHAELGERESAHHHFTMASRYLPLVAQGPFRVRLEFRISRGLAARLLA